MDVKSQIQDLSSFLEGQRTHWLSRARRRAWRLQTQTQEASWQARVQGWQRLDTLTNVLDGKPVVGRIADLVDGQLSRLTHTGIDGYDELTAKAVVAQIKTIEAPVRLNRIATYEAANKARKTVATAVGKRIAALEPDVVALPVRETPHDAPHPA